VQIPVHSETRTHDGHQFRREIGAGSGEYPSPSGHDNHPRAMAKNPSATSGPRLLASVTASWRKFHGGHHPPHHACARLSFLCSNRGRVQTDGEEGGGGLVYILKEGQGGMAAMNLGRIQWQRLRRSGREDRSDTTGPLSTRPSV
jgi:hypothetical protein